MQHLGIHPWVRRSEQLRIMMTHIDEVSGTPAARRAESAAVTVASSTQAAHSASACDSGPAPLSEGPRFKLPL
jgi:hypothetical protein